MITGVTAKQNPFPGLRPFREDEERFFFGRESQVDTMVNKLAATRFLAVVGTSGSGKSSLVNCGLRPALHRGLMASAGPAWRMAQFRPDVNPIHSLARSLGGERRPLFGIQRRCSDRGDRRDLPSPKQRKEWSRPSGRRACLKGQIYWSWWISSKSCSGIGNWEPRMGKSHTPSVKHAIAFVNLLLEASAQPDCPIYVVITMRSDFLGDCSQFYGLPEAINEGQYLVPRMTRDERRASIAGPVSVGGAEINPVLLTRLVNDVGDNPDQLSILQHALNRTWACWEFHGAEGELELEHYAEIGTMGEALNQHANEAFRQLETPEKAKICEKLFKALTDLGTDPRGIRRPLKLATLNEIVGTGSEEDVKAVIELFREPSRSFLMPPAPEPLESEKVIDISHESLMRVWERLRRWAEDEANSARRYRRLAETAALEKTGKARLWRDPDLQLALDWQEEQAPTPTWASLYGGDFESATAFLEKSRSERDHELAQVVFERRWRRIRLLIILLIAGFFLWRLSVGDFEWWSDMFGYKRYVKAPAPPAESLPLTQGLQERFEAVRDYGKSSVWNAGSFLLALACLLGPYLLGYFALAYFGKWAFRRFAFAKIFDEVALSSSKAVREQKLAEQALRPLDSKRSVVKLILLAIVWMIVFWVSSLFLAGALAGILNPKNAHEAGGKLGELLSGPFLLVGLGLSIWLTVAGKLPGTKKTPVARAGPVAVREQKRSVVKLILLAIAWMLVFLGQFAVPRGRPRWHAHPEKRRRGRRENRRITQRTVLVDCSRPIYLAHCSGKTARNKKASGCAGRTRGRWVDRPLIFAFAKIEVIKRKLQAR